MRALHLFALIACAASAACTQQPGGNVATAAPGNVSPSAKVSPAAKEAQSLAQQYIELINAKNYAAARAMWGHDGADVGGSTADFARTFGRYSQYNGKVGNPTEITTTAGQQYVAVAATANVTVKATGDKQVLAGLIRLRRPVDEAGQGAKWTIWAIDLRKPH